MSEDSYRILVCGDGGGCLGVSKGCVMTEVTACSFATACNEGMTRKKKKKKKNKTKII